MKKLLIALLIVVVLAGGGFVAYMHFNDNSTAESGLKLYGNVDLREVQVAFRVSERIAAMHLPEGASVARGELLAELEPRKLRLAVERAEARVAAQEQVVDELEAGTRSQEIEKARADVAAAEARVEETRRIYQRRRELVERELTSPEEVDNARAAMDTALARLQAAREGLDLAVAGPRQQDIAAARETLKALKAELAIARRDLNDARLTAPSDGVIRDRILEPGDMAFPQTPVYTLALTDPVWVRAYVAETDLGRIEPGQPATVHTDSFPGKSYDGWIGYISPTAEFTPKSVHTPELRTNLVYQVRVYVCNDDNELRLGMPATVEVQLDAESEAMRECATPGQES